MLVDALTGRARGLQRHVKGVIEEGLVNRWTHHLFRRHATCLSTPGAAAIIAR
ncbi:MAG: hypothetical protein OJF55_001439 [Rhodanobacteraceae bacterium]|nr:MAG: hypothetical protein OJF55_001439 [Rhodanobacteraceae bacterium]